MKFWWKSGNDHGRTNKKKTSREIPSRIAFGYFGRSFFFLVFLLNKMAQRDAEVKNISDVRSRNSIHSVWILIRKMATGYFSVVFILETSKQKAMKYAILICRRHAMIWRSFSKTQTGIAIVASNQWYFRPYSEFDHIVMMLL